MTLPKIRTNVLDAPAKILAAMKRTEKRRALEPMETVLYLYNLGKMRTLTDLERIRLKTAKQKVAKKG